MAYYFGDETDQAIVRYLETSDIDAKHRIFETGIRPAFEKLIENLIYVYRFFTIDDVDTLKREGLTNLYEMLPKYNPLRGTKGFSYFNVVARNWFIQKAREFNKKNRLESDLYYDLDHEFAKSDPSYSISPYEDSILEKEFWLSLFEEFDLWRERLVKPSERKVLEAIVFLMRNPDLVTIYNKKAVYLYLREITGLNTKQVVVNLKKIKTMYLRFRDGFNDGTG